MKRRTIRTPRLSGKMRRATGRSPRKRVVIPRTLKQYLAMSPQSQDRWTRVTHVISKMRAEDISLQKASREYGIDPRTVVRLGRPALRKGANGRYNAKASDRLLRVLVIPTREGLREVALRDSRQASQIAEYANAVQKYLQTGDDSALRKLKRRSITDATGKRVRLLMDLEEIDRLGSAGVLSFESLYARSA